MSGIAERHKSDEEVGRGRPCAELMYFSPELGHPAIARQIAAMVRVGLSVSVVGFSRSARFQDIEVPGICRVLRLGSVANLAYGKRLAVILRSLFRLARRRRMVESQDYMFVTGLDLGLLAMLVRRLTGSRAKLIYQVLDIRAVLQRSNLTSRVLRLAERFLLDASDLLVVSSPSFIDHYFMPFHGYSGKWELLENKLLCVRSLAERPSPELAVQQAQARAMRNGGWTIGWFGTLRCSRSLGLLCDLADSFGEAIRIQIAGVQLEIGEAQFRRAVSARRNVVFSGRYHAPEDLAGLYRDVDFIWCIDLTSGAGTGDRNPLWLLQNRLYEGGYFAVPALAADGTASGEKVDRDNLGWSFREPLGESLGAFFSELSRSEYLAKVRRIAESSSALYCDNGEDVAKIFYEYFAESRIRSPDEVPV